MKNLVNYADTPQVTALEYAEMRDLELHPEKSGFYKELVRSRTKLGKDFETPSKKKRRRSA